MCSAPVSTAILKGWAIHCPGPGPSGGVFWRMLLALCCCDFGYFISLLLMMFWTLHKMCFNLFSDVAMEKETNTQTNRKQNMQTHRQINKQTKNTQTKENTKTIQKT